MSMDNKEVRKWHFSYLWTLVLLLISLNIPFFWIFWSRRDCPKLVRLISVWSQTGDETSDDFNLNCGVPQGSCTWPILFTLYVSRPFNIISQHLPTTHGYADDIQIYLSFRPCSVHSEINAVSQEMFAFGLLVIV